ncbi:DUF4365 domain-containing protein [Streptacidiphilus albus]|uniref:DUF4365 domain-containing protein n=1 Tax=Streptacidiphilus albus TaxID=105425 RepID=UPI0007C6A9EA|nr:DUF4365 domain-containing protein [Streptacidiphilus albus]
MEQLQEGYIMDVAATSACLYVKQERDVFGMDAMLVRPSPDPAGEETSFYVQLKSTTQVQPDPTRETFSYQFQKREYMERLAAPRRGVKAILIVMAVPPQQAQWTVAHHSHLEVKQACYWINLEGVQVPTGVQKPSIRIPTKNLFDSSALNILMDSVGRGEPIND